MDNIAYADRDVNQCAQKNAPTNTVVSNAAQQQQEGPFKYTYDIFAGPLGKKKLSTILQQVLPLALFRTWLAMDAYQPTYGLLYVGVEQIAKDVRPQLRKIYIDLQEFEQRQLMVRTAGRVNKIASNQQKRWVNVTFKSFAPLYDLAYDYYQWQISEDYIAAMRSNLPQLRELIAAKPALAARLLRYESYRALLENRKPGRKTTAPAPQTAQQDTRYIRISEDIMIQQPVDRSIGCKPSQNPKGLQDDSQKGLNVHSPYRVNNGNITIDSDNSNHTSTEKKLKEVSLGVSSSPNDQLNVSRDPVAQVNNNKENNDYKTSKSSKQVQQITKRKDKKNDLSMTENETLRMHEYVEQFVTEHVQRTQQGYHAGGQKTYPRNAPAPCPPVTNVLSDIAHELNDQGGRSTLTRILRLYWQSRLTPEQFIELIYAVRFKVRGLPDNRFRRRGPNGKANRMPMFLMLIEKVMIHGLGVLEQQKPASKTEQLPVPEQSSTEQDPVANPQADEHSLPAPEHVAAEDTNSCGDRLLHTQNSTPPSTERLAIQPMCTDAESDAAPIQIPPPSMQRLATQPVLTDAESDAAPIQIPPPSMQRLAIQPVCTDAEGNVAPIQALPSSTGRLATQPVCTDAEGNVAPIQALPPSMKRSMSPEALRHQRTMQALKDVRHLVDEPLRIAPEGQACRDCGGIVKYSMHKCVICQPAKTWSMYDHKRICKALAKADAGSA